MHGIEQVFTLSINVHAELFAFAPQTILQLDGKVTTSSSMAFCTCFCASLTIFSWSNTSAVSGVDLLLLMILPL